MGRLKIATFSVLFVFSVLGTRAQDNIALDPRSPLPANGEKLEVEVVSIQRNSPTLETLHRKAGRFILLTINQARAIQDPGFIIDPAAVGDLKLGAAPLLRFGGPGISDHKHRAASLFDAAAGDFDLKFADSGKIVCHITIDPQ